MTPILEFIMYVHHFAPTVLGVTLFVAGIALSVMPWVLFALGGVVLLLILWFIQYMLNQTVGFGTDTTTGPGAALLQACALLPVSTTPFTHYPSAWIAMVTFYCVYIMRNAANVYQTKPIKASRDSIGVQQRMGMGLISFVTTLIVLLCLIVLRFYFTGTNITSFHAFFLGQTGCENGVGALLGLVIGLLWGVGWWTVLHICDSTLSDVHQVVGGLKADSGLKMNPLACSQS
jgi:hypothetical protein